MWAIPICFGAGVFFAIHACIHSCHALSAHMGSGFGVPGLSGRHTQPFVPARRVIIFPSAPMSAMVAFALMDAGAALVALAIFAAFSTLSAVGLFGAPLCCCAAAGTAATATIRTVSLNDMLSLHGDRG